MKTSKLIFAAVSLCFIFQSCSKQDDLNSEIFNNPVKVENIQQTVDLSDMDFRQFFANHNLADLDRSSTTSDVYTNTFEGDVVGSSNLSRNSHKITANFNASDAPNLNVSGHACTLWALIWNSAEEAFTGGHPYAMYRLAGKVVGNNDQINISGPLKEGQLADYYSTNFYFEDPETGEVFEFNDSQPFQDAETNFILLITKSHGPMIPSEMPGQILTFGGGCDGDPDSGGPEGQCYEYVYSFHF